MKRTVLIKEGEYRPSLFADFTETVNRPEAEQVGFFSRHDYTFRLTRNRSSLEPTFPLALAHYNVDVANPIQDPKLFRPIDTETMFKALETYDYVIFGAVTPTHIITDQSLFVDAMYIARNDDGKLVNAETHEVLHPDDKNVTFVTAFLGMVRMQGLPVYVIILNPSLTHVTDGFDYRHEPSDTLYSIVSDHDGTIRDTVFAPAIDGARVFGQTLLATQPKIILNFFSHPSVLRDAEIRDFLAASSYTIDTNTTHTIDGTDIHITLPASQVSYFNITFHCGTFFDIASIIEKPTFNYLIIRP